MARVVLPVAGAVVGAIWGGPQGAQWGWMIGSLVASAVDPLEMNGPRMGEGQQQTTQDGAPRPIIYGKGFIGSNIIAVTTQQKIYRDEQQGKGGPVVKMEYVYQTGCFRLAEGPIIGVSMIRENGTIVYDTRPGSTMLEESANYAKKFRLYLGDESQMPDPDLEAHFGVGLTCPHRGTANIVFHNFDQTKFQGAFPQFEFEVVGSGSVSDQGGGWLFGPTTLNGAAGGSQDYYLRAHTLEELPFATPTPAPHSFATVSKAQDGAVFLYSTSQMSVSHDRGVSWAPCTGIGFGAISTSRDVTWNGHYYYHGVYRSANGKAWEAQPNLPAGTSYIVGREFFNNPIVAVQYPSSGGSAQVSVSLDDGATWTNHPPSKFANWSIQGVSPGKLQFKFTLDSTRGYYTDDLFATLKAEGSAEVDYDATYSDDFHDTWMRKTFSNGAIWSDDGGVTWERTLSIALGSSAANSLAWGDYTWAAIRQVAGSPQAWYVNINREGGKPSGWSPELATPMYGNGGNIVWLGNRIDSVTTSDKVLLSDIVTDICDRAGVLASQIDVSELTDLVTGFVLAGAYAAREAIDSLRTQYFFDYLAVDGKIRFIKRGGAVKGVITDDDLMTEFEDTLTRDDAEEYPRVIHMDYQLSTNNYEPIKATSDRESEDVLVTGETSFTTPVVFDNVDEPEQIVDKHHKILESDAQGELRFVLGEEFLEATVTDCYAFQVRGKNRRIRLTHCEYADRELRFRARVDRQSASTSNVTGHPPTAPTPPPSSLVGETIFAILNTSGLIDQDDRLGIRVIVAGVSPGWHGAVVQMSSDDGQSYSDLITIVNPGRVGNTVTNLPASSKFLTDDVNVLKVVMRDSRVLQTISQEEFLGQGNAAVIIDVLGNIEYIKFRDVDDLGNQAYDLSYLARGRKNTNPVQHVPGSFFAMVNESHFIELPSSLMGRDLKFRVVALDSPVETARVYDFTWSPAYSQYEWPVGALVGTRTGNILDVSWQHRTRFGVALNPIPSVNFQGFRVTLIKGATTIVLPDQAARTLSYDVTALGAGVTVRVQAINRITGLGPSQEIVL